MRVSELPGPVTVTGGVRFEVDVGLGLGLDEGQLRDRWWTVEGQVSDGGCDGVCKWGRSWRVTEVVSGAGAEIWAAEEKVSSPA